MSFQQALVSKRKPRLDQILERDFTSDLNSLASTMRTVFSARASDRNTTVFQSNLSTRFDCSDKMMKKTFASDRAKSISMQPNSVIDIASCPQASLFAAVAPCKGSSRLRNRERKTLPGMIDAILSPKNILTLKPQPTSSRAQPMVVTQNDDRFHRRRLTSKTIESCRPSSIVINSNLAFSSLNYELY